ncbi:hypothetical protein MKP07_08885 [Niabella hibiscisoli]|nr:hypothetical protein [Niabella hibiscisoli]
MGVSTALVSYVLMARSGKPG